MIMEEICMDNRFEIIEAAKRDIIAATNIETSKDEMKVLDSILFRAWQMGWLDNKYDKHKTITNADRIRAMSDEELMHFLYNIDSDKIFGNFCSGDRAEELGCEDQFNEARCHECLLEWLRLPAEDRRE